MTDDCRWRVKTGYIEFAIVIFEWIDTFTYVVYDAGNKFVFRNEYAGVYILFKIFKIQ